MICAVYTVTPANVYTIPVAMANEQQFWQLHLRPLVGTCLTIHVCLHGENTQPKVVNMMYVGSEQKCLLDSNVLVTIYGYCSMFNPPHIWACDVATFLGVFVHCCLFACCSGGRWGNTEQVVAQCWHPVASGVALDMPHRTMPSVLLRRTAVAIKMAGGGGAFVRHLRFCHRQ